MADQLSEAEAANLARHSAEGQPFPRLRYPITTPLTSPWNLRITDVDYARLKIGHWNTDEVDDNWSIHTKADDAGNLRSVHIVRSFTMEWYILNLSLGEDGGAVIDSVTWDAEQHLGLKGYPGASEQAKKEAVHFCRGYLKCRFEGLPIYGKEIYDYPGCYLRKEGNGNVDES